MGNPEQGASVLSSLQREGVKIEIDDFGTGYSSLSSIHKLSPDSVKIDRSFVESIGQSDDKKTVVGAIVALADELKIDVVGEGIETEKQHAILKKMGVKYAQGFLYSQPLSPEKLFDYVVAENPLPAAIVNPVLSILKSATGNLPTIPNVNNSN